MEPTQIVISDYTEEAITGNGTFDVMMRGLKSHVVEEYTKGRIKGPEYATVYLGALQATMDRALQFLLEKDKRWLEVQLLQVELEKLEIEKEKAALEKDLISAQIIKINAEVDLVNAEVLKAAAQRLNIEADTLLVVEKAKNAVLEGKVLDAQACKLKAEFDVLVQQKDKVTAETALLMQKRVTEQAQTDGAAANEESVIGKQIVLYDRQGQGFLRDAEQKAAKLMLDTWNVRRTTDENTKPTTQARIMDVDIGNAVTKLLQGVGAEGQ